MVIIANNAARHILIFFQNIYRIIVLFYDFHISIVDNLFTVNIHKLFDKINSTQNELSFIIVDIR